MQQCSKCRNYFRSKYLFLKHEQSCHIVEVFDCVEDSFFVSSVFPDIVDNETELHLVVLSQPDSHERQTELDSEGVILRTRKYK